MATIWRAPCEIVDRGDSQVRGEIEPEKDELGWANIFDGGQETVEGSVYVQVQGWITELQIWLASWTLKKWQTYTRGPVSPSILE